MRGQVSSLGKGKKMKNKKIKSKKSVKISVCLDSEVYAELVKCHEVTEVSQKGLINQALRKFLNMQSKVKGEN